MHFDSKVQSKSSIKETCHYYLPPPLQLQISTSTLTFDFNLRLLTSLLNAHVITTLEHSGGV